MGESPVPFVLLCAGVLLAVGGAVSAMRAPRSSEHRRLRIIALAVQKYIDRFDDSAGFNSRGFVQLTADGGKRLTRVLSRTRVPVVALIGEQGAGKSVTSRQVVREICARGTSRRRGPKLMAVYVDLAALQRRGPINAEMIRAHVLETVGADDPDVRDAMEGFLRRPPDQPRWLFVFDSFDELPALWAPGPRERMAREYLDAIHRFVNAGPAFQAVITTRDNEFLESFTGLRVHVTPLSQPQQRKLIAAAGLGGQVAAKIIHRLRADWAGAVAASNPLLLSLICDHVSDTGGADLPADLYEIVDVAVTTRLRGAPGSRLTDQEVRSVAEDVAYCLASDDSLGRAPTDHDLIAALGRRTGVDAGSARLALEHLRRARIAQNDRPGSFAFAHSVFLDHFAAGWLLRAGAEPEVRDLLTDHRWREAVIAALRLGPSDKRRRLLETAGDILDREAASIDLARDVHSLLGLSPRQQLPMATGSFTWPPPALHILRILAESVRHQNDTALGRLRTHADVFVLNAFIGGTQADQRPALELLACTSSEVAVWATERASSSRSTLLRRAAAHSLVSVPETFADLSSHGRWDVLRYLPRDVPLVDRTLAIGDTTPPGTGGSFPRTLLDLLRVGQICSVGLIILGVWRSIGLWNENHLEWSDVMIPVFLGVSGGAFLVGWSSAGCRLPSLPAKLTVYGISAATAILFAAGIATVEEAVIEIVHGRLGNAIGWLIAIHMATWPVAVVAALTIKRPTRPGEWTLPHLMPVRKFAARYRTRSLKANMKRNAKTGLALAAVAGFLAGYTLAPVGSFPHADPVAVRENTGLTAALVLLVMIVLAAWWRRRLARAEIRRRLADEPPSGEQLQEWLRRATYRPELTRLLRLVDATPAEKLVGAADVLSDLDRALEQVTRMVPRRTTMPIPAAVWDVGPEFISPGFREWMIAYDKDNPGLLPWLAEPPHRDQIAGAVERVRGLATRGRTAQYSP
ncbi:NACHT domain-containing protein [Actinomadura spongiicola]|nr:NACHT domain-containing protein [Actinomadura spongiicola]